MNRPALLTVLLVAAVPAAAEPPRCGVGGVPVDEADVQACISPGATGEVLTCNSSGQIDLQAAAGGTSSSITDGAGSPTKVETDAVAGEVTTTALGEIVMRASNDGTNSRLRIEADSSQSLLAFEVLDSSGTTAFYFNPETDVFGLGSAGTTLKEFASNKVELDLLGNGADYQFSNNALTLLAVTRGVTLQRLSPTATLPPYSFVGDLDTGTGSAAADQLSLIAGAWEGIRITEASDDYVTVAGCSDYGSLAAAPSGASDCDRYYDNTAPGAFCIYVNGAWAVAAGGGSCA